MSDLGNAKPFDPSTVNVGDEVLIRCTITDIDRRNKMVIARHYGPTRYDEIAGVIPAPEPPRRPDGWSADGKSVDPWHGVSAEERDRRCEAARRAVEEAHRPHPEWQFCTYIDDKGVFACRGERSVGFGCYGREASYHRYSKLIDDPLRKPLTAAEAHQLLTKLGGVGAEEFCKLTGYVPPKQCEGWRFTDSTIGKACFAFHDDGRGYFISWGDVIKATNPRTFADAIADSRRREITAAEAYEICKANWQGAKFREITGYKP